MNRREFLKSMLVMAGAACLGVLRPAPPMATLIVTDPLGRITTITRPIHVITGDGEVWHTHNLFNPMPLWERGASPSRYFVNPRIAERVASFVEGAWAW